MTSPSTATGRSPGGAFLGVLKKSGAVGSPEQGTADAPDLPAAAEQASGVEQEARDAALTAVMKHWSKRPDGWITARTTGSSAAPIQFLRQIRALTVDEVRAYGLSDSDRLNGFEWAGEVSFKRAPCREAGEPGVLLDGLVGANMYRQRGRWSQWVDWEPEPVHVQKVNGEWQVNEDTWLLRGKIPGVEDLARAGVK